MRELKFKREDYSFIKLNYPDFFSIISSRAIERNGFIYYPMYTEQDYDFILDKATDNIADSVDKDGELTSKGLRLERAWDYADWSD